MHHQRRHQFDRVRRAAEDRDAADRKLRGLELRLHQVARGLAVIGIGRDAHLVGRLHRPLVDRRAVERIDQRAQQRVAGQHEHRQHDRLDELVGAGAGADRGRTPQRRRGVEPPDVLALLHDHAGAEEADAGDHVGDHMHAAGDAVEAHAEVDEGGGAHRHQHVGPQPARPLPVLPFGADQRAQHERAEHAEQGIEELNQREGFERGHQDVRATEGAGARPLPIAARPPPPAPRQRAGGRRVSRFHWEASCR